MKKLLNLFITFLDALGQLVLKVLGWLWRVLKTLLSWIIKIGLPWLWKALLTLLGWIGNIVIALVEVMIKLLQQTKLKNTRLGKVLGRVEQSRQNKNRPILWGAVFVLIIFLPLAFLRLKTPKGTEAAWFDEGWRYRIAITIDNNTSFDGTNIPYKATIDTATLISAEKMQSNGNDIRVLDRQGKYVRYQVEQSTLNSTTTGIWFEGTIEANSSATYYIYYGNSSAPATVYPSDVSSAGDGSTVEMADGFGYSTSASYGKISDIRKDGANLGVNGNYHVTTSYPDTWWNDRTFARTLLNSGPLFVEVKYEDTNYGSYSSYGTNIKMFANGFAETRVFLNYNASGSENLYYYLSFDNDTRNSLWVDSSGTLVDQAVDSGTLYESNLKNNWFGQRWTTSGNYGGTIITKNGSDWNYGNTSAQASYYQKNYSYTEAYTDGSSREIRYGVFAGTGSSADMSQKASLLGGYTTSLQSEEISPGPIAHWKFDEGYGTTANDSTSNGNSGELKASATWATEDLCISGKCVFIDDTGSVFNSIQVEDDNSLGNMPALTVSVWVKIVEDKTYHQIIYKRQSDGSPAWYSYLLRLDNLKPTFLVANSSGTNNYAQADSAIELNKWYHLTGVYDGSQIQIYVNTAAADSTPPSLTGDVLNSNSQLLIGGLDTPETYFTHGYIDEVKIYPYARTAAQIKSDYNARGTSFGTGAMLGASNKNLDAFSNGLVGYWKMDESSGDAIDSSGNGNTGTWSGSGSHYPAGKFGNGGGFNGTDDYVSLAAGATALDITGDISVSLWFYPDNLDSILIDNRYNFNGNEYGYHLQTKADGTVLWSSHDGVTNANEACVAHSTGKIIVSQWNHILVTKAGDSTTVNFYINGQPAGTDTVAATGIAYSGSYTTRYIGTARDTYPYSNSYEFGAKQYPEGNIDETRIYNRALSSAEVSQLYNWAPGPITYYNFEEGSGIIAQDVSGNNNTGAISGATYTTSQYGKALDFDGDDNVSTPHSNDFDFDSSQSFTVSLWMKQVGSIANFGRIFEKRDVPGLIGYSCYSHGTENYLRCNLSDGSDHAFSFSDITVFDGDWHHLSFVVNRSTQLATAYMDGIKSSTNIDISTYGSLANSDSLFLGSSGVGNYSRGNIDEFKIYNYARTPGQIIEDMNADHPLGGSPIGSQVGYWKFDEGYGTTANDAVGGNNGIITGASWSNSGKFGKALNFDGGNNAVTIPLQNHDDITVSSWFKRDSQDAVNADSIFGGWYWTADAQAREGYDLRFYVDDNTLDWTIETTDGATVTEKTVQTSAISLNTWYHVTGTYDSVTGISKVYLNGVLQAQSSASPGNTLVPQTQYADMKIGYSRVNNGYFPGLIDEVKLYNTALTAEEIKIDMNAGSAVNWGTGTVENRDIVSGASLYLDATNNTSYPGSGTNWYDISGNGYNATLSSPTYDGQKFTTTSATIAGLGSSVYTDISANTTILWVYPETGGGSAWSVTDQDSHTYMTYSVGGSAYINTWETGGYTQRTIWNATESQPTQIVITKNGSVRTVYENMIQKGQVTINNPASSVNSNLVFGNASNNMGLSIVEVYNRVLTTDEITQDYVAHASKFDLDAGPVGEWNFEEKTGTDTYDTSGNGRTGTITSGTWLSSAQCKTGSCLNYNGTSTQVDVGTIPLTSTGTVQLWFKYDSAQSGTSYERLISVYDTSENEFRILVDAASPRELYWIHKKSNVTTSYSSQAFDNSAWHQLSYTVDGTNATMFLDGQQVFTTTNNVNAFNYSANWYLGNGSSYEWPGQIDQVRIYDYARTPAQVAWDYNRGAPVAHYKLDECQSTTANDSSGNGNSGTITIGATGTNTTAGTCSTSGAWADGATGKFNSSLEFDGTDDYVLLPNNLFTAGDPFSTSVWVNLSDDTHRILSLRGDMNFVLRVSTLEAVAIYSGTWNDVGTISLGTWQHIATTFDGTTFKTYINGNLSNSYDETPGSSSFSNAIGIAGWDLTTDPTSGQVDDVQIFNYALTPTQVKSVMNQNSAIRFGPNTGTP